MARRNFRPRSSGTLGRPTLTSNCCVRRSARYSSLQAWQSDKWSCNASISVPVTTPSKYGENRRFAWGHCNPAFFTVPFMKSPRPFYPHRKPDLSEPGFLESGCPNSDSLCCPRSERSIPVRFQLHVHRAPAVAAVRLCRESAVTSPSPGKSPALRQSLRTTYLPDRAKSEWSGRAPVPWSALLPPYAALRDARRYQTENRHDRSVPPASHFPKRSGPPIPPAQSKSLSLYAGTTTVVGWRPHAGRCGRSRSSNSTHRENSSCRETLSETRPGLCRPRPPDHSQSGRPARTPAAEIPRSTRRRPLPSRPSVRRRSPLLPATALQLHSPDHPRWLLPP